MSTNQAVNLKIVLDASEATLKLNTVAARYMAIKKEIEALTESLKPYKEKLEEAALNAPELTVALDDYTIKLIEAERENFGLKEAKIKLGLEILEPFIKVTSYTQLRVNEKE